MRNSDFDSIERAIRQMQRDQESEASGVSNEASKVLNNTGINNVFSRKDMQL